MDRLGVALDHINNTLVQGSIKHPIVRKWGHPWLLLDDAETMAWCNLTESELRRIHRRFGHPSVRRLADILDRAGESNDGDSVVLEKITRGCHQCQLHAKAPSRFKFRIRDTDPDFEFNAEIIIDIFYLDGHPVLHVVDSATAFQAAKFIKDMSTKHVWEALKLCWIDVYQGPPERMVHDAGKNFTSVEFKQSATAMAIDVEEVPVEAHNSIGKVERYHGPLRRAFNIIKAEMPGTIADVILQAAVKAINDTAGPRGLVPTLLVFGSYPRITSATTTSPTPSIQQRAQAIQQAMKELREYQARRQVGDALKMRNGPCIDDVLKLRPGDEVLVWREAGAWTGPFRLLAIDDVECTVQISHGPTRFRITSIRPYHRDHETDTADRAVAPIENNHDPIGNDDALGNDTDQPSTHEGGLPSQLPDKDFTPQQPPPKRKPGRPRGSKNKPKPSPNASAALLSTKEIADFNLATRLRAEKKITTPGRPFEASDEAEIDALIANGIFRFEMYDERRHIGRVFRSRLVGEVKNRNAGQPYEKSRLVIQGFGDDEKRLLLTQAPTIQRASQRLILALAPSLFELPASVSDDSTNNARVSIISLYLRDITMAYTQSTTALNRTILAELPSELRHLYAEGTIMIVVKPLYGIAEAGTHWWATYTNHHREELGMTVSTYDPCLLIATEESKGFGVVGIQTDDTLILADEDFAADEERRLTFKSKPRQEVTDGIEISFNGCKIRRTGNTLDVVQKGQGGRIELISTGDNARTTKYVEQRARGAYIASICQPEATFDLSTAAQTRDPTTDDIRALNRRLQWQMTNAARGVTYVPIDLASAALYIFVDGSFANNRDLSSQIGYVIVLGNEKAPNPTENIITLRGNIIHWSSTKCKRVTRSVLASEIHGMSSGVDIGYALNETLNQIMTQLGRPPIPLIVCTDSFSLYECIVKLGTTKEKRLMIDIMALRQMYEKRELVEVRWISGRSNPADSMTKAAPNHALASLIDNNELELGIEGWVER